MKYTALCFAAVAAVILCGCAKDVDEKSVTKDGASIIATATCPGALNATKVAYTDTYSEAEEIADISAAWEKGDSFTAIEINGDVITTVKFSTDGSGASADFKSNGAVPADDNTTWVAVNGDVSVKDGKFVCKYEGQNGGLDNIGKYDFTVAEAKGSSPVFDFAKGKRLSYVMRLLLPAGIKYIEFNTGVTNEGGWTISSLDKINGTLSSTERDAVKTIELASVSSAKSPVYIAVPAIDCMESSENRYAGIIVTILSSDKKSSQGKTTSPNLTDKGGSVGTFDMSNLELLARPLASEAIKLKDVRYDNNTYNLGSWAPFNLGGKPNAISDSNIAGGLFAWGETEPRTSFSKATYKLFDGENYHTQKGNKITSTAAGEEPYIEYWDVNIGYKGNSGPGTYYDIGGTKYDAARVKWGSEWRLPSNEIAVNVLGDGQNNARLARAKDTEKKLVFEEYAPGTYKNSEGYTSTAFGAVVIKANGAEMVLYKCPYTDDGALMDNGKQGRYLTSTTDYGTTTTPVYWNKCLEMRLDHLPNDLYLNNKSSIWDGRSVRAVLNE